MMPDDKCVLHLALVYSARW